MRVLIVRLSSMGDLVQTLPALTDAARAIPEIRFDWAVDESFAQVPAWHRNVENVFPSAFKRWGSNLASALSKDELGSFVKRLRRKRYDAVVDVQGEWKSATISLLARGPSLGYDGRSVHEWGAHLTYSKTFNVPKGQHSIRRMRQLLSQALSYSYNDDEVDYGIDRSRLPVSNVTVPSPYVVFIHSTSWESKNWPESYWRELVRTVTASGLSVVIPWGTTKEQERSQRIAEDNERVFVLPQLSIAEKASIIANASATVGLDTGLSHIAAAFGIPSVTIYGATDPALVGATGKNQVHIASEFECVRCHEENCSYDRPIEFKPACFVSVSPERVWIELRKMVAN